MKKFFQALKNNVLKKYPITLIFLLQITLSICICAFFDRGSKYFLTLASISFVQGLSLILFSFSSTIMPMALCRMRKSGRAVFLIVANLSLTIATAFILKYYMGVAANNTDVFSAWSPGNMMYYSMVVLSTVSALLSLIFAWKPIHSEVKNLFSLICSRTKKALLKTLTKNDDHTPINP